MEPIRQSDITRIKILEAAYAEIHRHGFQGASIANILASTGLTKGALYYHFPTKQALGLAVVDEIIQERLMRLFFEPLRVSPKPIETLLAILENIPERVHEFIPLGCPMNNLMQEMSPIDPQFREHLSVLLNRWLTSVEQALQRAQIAGDLKSDVDCRATALFIISAWEGCIGTAKNLQSIEVLLSCGRQLQVYIRNLMK
jgi:TetR/AcrR family transcriptional repressor of nem operon